MEKSGKKWNDLPKSSPGWVAEPLEMLGWRVFFEDVLKPSSIRKDD